MKSNFITIERNKENTTIMRNKLIYFNSKALGEKKEEFVMNCMSLRCIMNEEQLQHSYTHTHCR